MQKLVNLQVLSPPTKFNDLTSGSWFVKRNIVLYRREPRHSGQSLRWNRFRNLNNRFRTDMQFLSRTIRKLYKHNIAKRTWYWQLSTSWTSDDRNVPKHTHFPTVGFLIDKSRPWRTCRNHPPCQGMSRSPNNPFPLGNRSVHQKLFTLSKCRNSLEISTNWVENATGTEGEMLRLNASNTMYRKKEQNILLTRTFDRKHHLVHVDKRC